MTKYSIEEGEVLEKKLSKKKLFLALMSSILVAFTFYLFMKYDLLGRLKVDQLESKSLNNPPKNTNALNFHPDYSDEIAQIKLQVKTLSAENRNFKAKLKTLTEKLNQTNMSSNDEHKELFNKQSINRVNHILESILYSLDRNLKNGENLRAIQSDFDRLILVLILFSWDIDDSIITQVEEFKKTIEDDLKVFMDQADSELISVHNKLWTAVVNNLGEDSITERKPTEKDNDKHISSGLEKPRALRKKIKEEFMKFIDIEPLDNGMSSHNSNLDRLRLTTELSVKIAFSRSLLLSLELDKLNSYLSVIKNSLELYFPEMVDSINAIAQISKKIDNFDFDVEGLDEIISLLKNNIEEQ